MSGAPGLCTQTELLDKLVQQAEKRIDRYQPAERGKPEDKLSVCLNACMKWFPESGRDSLVHDIVHCANDDELYTVFASIYTGLLSTGKRRVRTESGIASTSAKGSSVMRAIDTANDAFPKSSRRGCDFRHACLQRDDYRCVVTKDMDTKHWQEIGEPDGVAYGNVLAAHIIPFAYALLKEESTLFRYFPAVRRAGMSLEHINNLSNGLCLRNTIHREFRRFRCAFEATDTPNVYHLKLYKRYPTSDRKLLPDDGIVRLHNVAEGQDGVLPNPVFLDYHYRIAEIRSAIGIT